METAPALSETTLAEYAGGWLDGRPDLAVRTLELYWWLLLSMRQAKVRKARNPKDDSTIRSANDAEFCCVFFENSNSSWRLIAEG